MSEPAVAKPAPLAELVALLESKPTLRRVHELAIERFPKQEETLEAFFSVVAESMRRPASPATTKAVGKNLRELEDYWDALLLGERYHFER